ncbi:hypothetical protein [Arcobacter sp. CECT 8985]|uniref:hypothetical protein n=1 Tax=Arcobacter sp. CECT 8985 TaxID=1935424 RepID=UPI0013E9492F|nr:hypothetical protein [Arcobacter sp. CECT 8985]
MLFADKLRVKAENSMILRILVFITYPFDNYIYEIIQKLVLLNIILDKKKADY